MLQLIFIGLLVALSFALFNRSKISLPGPKGLPFVGYGPFVGEAPHVTFMNLARKYGPIFKIQLGSQEWIILNSKEAIQEAFIKNGKSTSGRVHNMIMTAMVGERSMGFTTNLDIWKPQRVFGTKALKSYGTRKMEEAVRQEGEYLHLSLAEAKDAPCDCQHNIVKAVCNVACQITVGKRYDYKDEEYNKILKSAEILSRGDAAAKRLANMMNLNLLRYIPSYASVFNTCVSAFREIRREIENHVAEHKQTFCEGDVRDMTDEFLIEIAKRENKAEIYSETQIPYMMQDVIIASSDTTTNTIRWCLVGLSTNHVHQERIYQEVSASSSKSCYISMADQPKMPFTRAYLQEIMRFCNTAPLGLPHCSTEEFTLSGFNIPKSTPIIANFWAVHRSPSHFDNPDQFRPERFLDVQGNFIPCDDVMPFSVGPRRCFGEQLAKIEVFLFLTHLVSKFQILPDEDGPEMKLGQGMMIFTFAPINFRARFVERK